MYTIGFHLPVIVLAFITIAATTYAGVMAYALYHLVLDRSQKRGRHD